MGGLNDLTIGWCSKNYSRLHDPLHVIEEMDWILNEQLFGETILFLVWSNTIDFMLRYTVSKKSVNVFVRERFITNKGYFIERFKR